MATHLVKILFKKGYLGVPGSASSLFWSKTLGSTTVPPWDPPQSQVCRRAVKKRGGEVAEPLRASLDDFLRDEMAWEEKRHDLRNAA